MRVKQNTRTSHRGWSGANLFWIFPLLLLVLLVLLLLLLLLLGSVSCSCSSCHYFLLVLSCFVVCQVSCSFPRSKPSQKHLASAVVVGRKKVEALEECLLLVFQTTIVTWHVRSPNVDCREWLCCSCCVEAATSKNNAFEGVVPMCPSCCLNCRNLFGVLFYRWCAFSRFSVACRVWLHRRVVGWSVWDFRLVCRLVRLKMV